MPYMYLYCRADDSRELSEPASGGSGASASRESSRRPSGVLLSRRRSQGAGADTKAAWRRLPPDFFSNASSFLRARSMPHRVVELEGWPLLDQARLFAGSRLVVGAHGAALSNTLVRALQPSKQAGRERATVNGRHARASSGPCPR